LRISFDIDIDHDPRKIARDDRKDRIIKNEKKHSQNVARANGGNAPSSNTHPRDARKTDIEKTLATSRISTASMGKFDKKLDGEKKLRGVKRKVCRFSSSIRYIC
jgi:regulator of ribosome biosynthesis